VGAASARLRVEPAMNPRQFIATVAIAALMFMSQLAATVAVIACTGRVVRVVDVEAYEVIQ
jgi:hypothetical protein